MKINKIESNENEELSLLTADFEGEEHYYDDCAICQAMKKADEENRELTRDEINEAFKKAGGVFL